MGLSLECRVVAENLGDYVTIETQVDITEAHGGWTTTERWSMKAPRTRAQMDDLLRDELDEHGWECDVFTRAGAQTTGAISPRDWYAVINRCSATLQQLERVQLARNGLVAAAPEQLSKVKLAQAAGFTRVRVYQLRGYGDQPGFSF